MLSLRLSCEVTARPTLMLVVIATVWAVPSMVQVTPSGEYSPVITLPTRVIRIQYGATTEAAAPDVAGV